MVSLVCCQTCMGWFVEQTGACSQDGVRVLTNQGCKIVTAAGTWLYPHSHGIPCGSLQFRDGLLVRGWKNTHDSASLVSLCFLLFIFLGSCPLLKGSVGEVGARLTWSGIKSQSGCPPIDVDSSWSLTHLVEDTRIRSVIMTPAETFGQIKTRWSF